MTIHIITKHRTITLTGVDVLYATGTIACFIGIGVILAWRG